MNETNSTAFKVRRLLQDLQKCFQCTICLDLLSQPVSTKCNHQFCRKCLNELLCNTSKKKTVACPLCNSKVTKRSINPNEKLETVVSAVKDVCNAADQDCARLGVTPILSQRHRPNKNISSTKKKSLTFLGKGESLSTPKNTVFDFIDDINTTEEENLKRSKEKSCCNTTRDVGKRKRTTVKFDHTITSDHNQKYRDANQTETTWKYDKNSNAQPRKKKKLSDKKSCHRILDVDLISINENAGQTDTQIANVISKPSSSPPTSLMSQSILHTSSSQSAESDFIHPSISSVRTATPVLPAVNVDFPLNIEGLNKNLKSEMSSRKSAEYGLPVSKIKMCQEVYNKVNKHEKQNTCEQDFSKGTNKAILNQNNIYSETMSTLRDRSIMNKHQQTENNISIDLPYDESESLFSESIRSSSDKKSCKISLKENTTNDENRIEKNNEEIRKDHAMLDQPTPKDLTVGVYSFATPPKCVQTSRLKDKKNTDLFTFITQLESPNQDHSLFGNLALTKVPIPKRKIVKPRKIVNCMTSCISNEINEKLETRSGIRSSSESKQNKIIKRDNLSSQLSTKMQLDSGKDDAKNDYKQFAETVDYSNGVDANDVDDIENNPNPVQHDQSPIKSYSCSEDLIPPTPFLQKTIDDRKHVRHKTDNSVWQSLKDKNKVVAVNNEQDNDRISKEKSSSDLTSSGQSLYDGVPNELNNGITSSDKDFLIIDRFIEKNKIDNFKNSNSDVNLNDDNIVSDLKSDMNKEVVDDDEHHLQIQVCTLENSSTTKVKFDNKDENSIERSEISQNKYFAENEFNESIIDSVVRTDLFDVPHCEKTLVHHNQNSTHTQENGKTVKDDTSDHETNEVDLYSSYESLGKKFRQQFLKDLKNGIDSDDENDDAGNNVIGIPCSDGIEFAVLKTNISKSIQPCNDQYWYCSSKRSVVQKSRELPVSPEQVVLSDEDDNSGINKSEECDLTENFGEESKCPNKIKDDASKTQNILSGELLSKQKRKFERERLADKLSKFVNECNEDFSSSDEELKQVVFNFIEKKSKQNRTGPGTLGKDLPEILTKEQMAKSDGKLELIPTLKDHLQTQVEKEFLEPVIENVIDTSFKSKKKLSPTTPLTCPIPISHSTSFCTRVTPSKRSMEKDVKINESTNYKHGQLISNSKKSVDRIVTKSSVMDLCETNDISFSKNQITKNVITIEDSSFKKINELTDSARKIPSCTTYKDEQHANPKVEKLPEVHKQSPCTTTSCDLSTEQQPNEKRSYSPVVMMSRLTKKQVNACVVFCQKLGGKALTVFDDNATHLILTADENNCVSKLSYTYKYLLALVSGLWIVNVKWIIDSMKAGQFLPEKEYEVKGDPNDNQTNVPAFFRNAVKTLSHHLFDGFRISLVGSFHQSQIKKEQLIHLLEKLGSELVYSINEICCSSNQVQSVLIADDMDEFSKTDIDLIERYSLQVIHPEWVVNCIINFKLQETREYILSS